MAEKSQKPCKSEHKMDYASHASAMIAAIAGPRGWNDTRQRWLERAARKLGFTYSRTFSLFYQRARIIPVQEWDRMIEEIQSLRQTADRSQEVFDELDVLLERNRPQGAGPNTRPVAGDDCKTN